MTLDPVAALMLDEAGPLPERVLIIDDVGASLTRAASDAGVDVLTWCDDLREARQIPMGLRVRGGLPPGWAPELVLWRLPQAVSAVEDYAEHLAPLVATTGRIVAGGRTKHMTLAQNEALARQFGDVRASRGRQKSRVLHASSPQPGRPRWPMRRHLPEVGVTTISHGNVFAANRLDDGTHLLLRTLSRSAGDVVSAARSSRGVALDVGCGSGVVATWLAQRAWETTGTDVSASALASTTATARANGVRVTVRRTDMLTQTRPESADLIASNPPFHIGAAKDSSPTLRMIADAGRVLRPGGELWLVFNGHLPYLQHLRWVGTTTVEAQDRHYIVTRTLKE